MNPQRHNRPIHPFVYENLFTSLACTCGREKKVSTFNHGKQKSERNEIWMQWGGTGNNKKQRDIKAWLEKCLLT